MDPQDPTQRFTDRVANYVRYRPSYPAAVIDTLQAEAGLPLGGVVADVGSGTGILTRLLLDAGHAVYAVEPNDAMRAAAEGDLASYPGFHSVNGTAEATTLPAASVDLVTAGQAFHWFDPDASRVEFARILRPGGFVAMVWNMRRTTQPGFMADYEAMLQAFGLSYNDVKQSAHMGEMSAVFGETYTTRVFPNRQVFDFEGLRGRLLSSSYAPPPGHPLHEPMLAALRALFDQYEQAGVVAVEYETQLYWGKPVEPPAG
jgi:SAM-dependent methyltransferase